MRRFWERGGFWVVAQAVLIALVLLCPGLLGRNLGWHGRSQQAVGVAIAALGFVFLVLGVIGLGKSLTPLPKPAEGASLRVGGVFRLVRHPIYSGILLMALGYTLQAKSMLAVLSALLLGAFFFLKARQEEDWLVERYPEYREYRSKTKGFFPYLW